MSEELRYQMKRAYASQMNRAQRELKSLANMLANIKDGVEPAARFHDARERLAQLTKAVHEASAYHNAVETAEVEEACGS